jgi:hypothetical protein
MARDIEEKKEREKIFSRASRAPYRKFYPHPPEKFRRQINALAKTPSG